MTSRFVLGCLVVAGLGCAELPILVPNTCGNAVREGGEDCDLFPDEALGTGLTCGDDCRYVCAPDVEAPDCPTGWACGRDGTCRFGAGTYALSPESPLLFSTRELLVGDIDADGAVDVVGGDAATIEVRFGSASGALQEPFRVTSDFPVAPRGLAFVGQGPQLDLLAPTQEGIDLYYGDEARQIVPAGFTITRETDLLPNDATSDDVALVPLRATGRAVDETLAVYVQGPRLFAAVADLEPDGPGFSLPLGPAPGPLLPRLVPARLEPGGDFAVAVATAGAAAVHIVALSCAPAADCSGPLATPRPREVATVPVAPLGEVATGTQLADLDGDGVADLLISVRRGAGDLALVVALGLGGGAFDPPVAQRLPSDFCVEADGCWPLALGDLDGQGRTEVVLPSGIWTSTGSTAVVPRLVAASFERQGAAEIVDLDGDGRLDVVMTSATRSVLQFSRNAGDAFNPVLIDVQRPVRLLRSGDFDGDGVGDVAIVQDTLSSSFGVPVEVSDVSVIFGSRSGPPRAPELMGRFLPITRLEPGRLAARGVLDDDAISDLVVQTESPVGARVGFMTGTGQRRLHAPLVLPAGSRRPTSVPAAVLGADIDVDGGRDLLALTFAEVAGGPDSGPLLYLIRGFEDGGYELDDWAAFSPETSCLTSDALGHGCMQVGRGRFEGGFSAVVVNEREDCPSPVAVPPRALTRLSFGAGDTLMCASMDLTGVEDWPRPSTPHFADIDADGHEELLVLYRGGPEPGPRGLAVWDDPSAAPEWLRLPEAVVLSDFAAIDADGDPALEIAVLAGDGVYLLDRIQGGYTWPSAPIIDLPSDGSTERTLGAADLDGDGLTDILVGSQDRLSVHTGQQAWLGGPPPEEMP